MLRTGRDLSERDGVGFETRPDGSAVGRDLSERGGVGFETRPDGSAVGRDLSERDAATSANEAGATSANEAGATSAGGQPRPQRTTRHPRAMSKALQSMPDGASDRTDASRP